MLGKGHKLIFKVSADRLYDDLICGIYRSGGKNDAAAACMCVPRRTTTQKWCWPTLSLFMMGNKKALAINSCSCHGCAERVPWGAEPGKRLLEKLGWKWVAMVWLVSLVSHCGLPLVFQIEAEWTSSCSCIVFSIPCSPPKPPWWKYGVMCGWNH